MQAPTYCEKCGDFANLPVVVETGEEFDPLKDYCIKCAIENELCFYTPMSICYIDEINEAMEVWKCDIEEAYNKLEDGEHVD